MSNANVASVTNTEKNKQTDRQTDIPDKKSMVTSTSDYNYQTQIPDKSVRRLFPISFSVQDKPLNMV